MVSYANAGEVAKATEVFHLMQNSCREYEGYDRALEFAERNLGESGVIN
jgi:pentatricopeptide repeat protein